MKIAVYCPSLNEQQNAVAWAASCADADYRVVIDTGSTDQTKQLLMDQGVTVYDVLISPWRFDDAYNVAMSLVPADADVLICLHMDERLDTGWRRHLESAWTEQTTRLRYTYIWNWNSDGSPGRQWLGDRIHARRGYRWMGATHEGLCSRLPEHQSTCAELRILHYPENKHKSGDLALLEEAVREAPHDSRIRAYLGREYMYKGMHEQSLATYREFLTMPSWNVERGLAMQHLAVVDPSNKIYWLKSACMETPQHREPRVALSRHYYSTAEWSESLKYAQQALDITVHPMDYSCTEESWGWMPHDLAAIASWNLGLRKEALAHAQAALEFDKTDQRLQNNVKLIEQWFVTNEVS
jgi:tetratricopeptide (TPR) repeat protein